MYLQEVEKLFEKNLFFVGVLKVNDENSRIRIRIYYSEAWIRGSGSTPKCHGSGTLTCKGKKLILRSYSKKSLLKF
jgi:hypothetical protein